MSGESRFNSVTHYLFLLAMLGIAFVNGQLATATLTTAFDPDLYRDIGQAYSIYYGHWFADPQLMGEQQWYNPLTAALIAGISHLINLDPAITYVRAGAYVGLLAPVAFYLFLRVAVNQAVALVGVAAFIFLASADPQVPYPASYSPWLHSWNLAQVFFYLALSSLFLFTRRSGNLLLLSTGLLWGLTFLAHFYPALLLGAIAITCCVLGKLRLHHFLSMATLAFIVGLPFTWTILFHYHMAVINTLVVEWVYEDIKQLLPYLLLHLNWQLPLLVAGAWVLIKHRSDAGTAIVGIWSLIVITSVLYTSFWHDVRDIGFYLPPLTFSIHASFYFSAVLSTLFALGTVSALHYLASKTKIRWKIPIELAAVTLILVLYLPSYSTRAAFAEWPVFARYNQDFFDSTGFTRWIIENTDGQQVFLARPTQSLSMVISHGRKVVAGPALWANPYVDMNKRLQDQEAMFEALAINDWTAFFQLAEQYQVDYLLLLGDESGYLPPEKFRLSLRHPGLIIYAVQRPSDGGYLMAPDIAY
jgi:hypothetical protein